MFPTGPMDDTARRCFGILLEETKCLSLNDLTGLAEPKLGDDSEEPVNFVRGFVDEELGLRAALLNISLFYHKRYDRVLQ